MRRSTLGVGLALAIVFCATDLAFAAKKLLTDIPLVWKPTDTKGAGVVNLLGIETVKVKVKPFTDSRPDKAKFGENTEDDEAKPVTTSGSVAEFCAKNLAGVFRSYGISMVEEGADYILGGDVLEFMVSETNNYKGEVRLKITLLKGDKPVWTGIAAGTNKRFGRSYKAENYYETISDSLLQAAQSLINDQGFHKALAGN
jgi:hypothetical protein